MNHIEAYQILNLPYGSSTDEIQKRFAKLVVIYKPDDSPTEFMKIHEAYKLLTKHSSTSTNPSDIFSDTVETIFDEWDNDFQQLDDDFDVEEARIQAEKEQKEKEEAILRIQKEEKLNQAALLAFEQLEQLLLEPENRFTLKKLKVFLKQKEIIPFLTTDIFMNGIKSLFEKTCICYEYCSALLKTYDFLTESSLQNMQRIEMRKFLLEKKSCAPDILPDPMSWKHFLPILIAYALFIAPNNTTFIGNMIHITSIFLFFFGEWFLRQKLHWRKSSAIWFISLIYTIIGFFMIEYRLCYLDPENSMVMWCLWFTLSFVNFFIRLTRPFGRSASRNMK
ncbi:MAG: J domain-containing protein [Schaedlerella sp.]|nr:J domain-containing protein [Schaedlerella sp.]